MDRSNEYLRRAADAQKMADCSVRAQDKAAWLRIAQGWMELTSKPPTPTERFDDHVLNQGTGQADSQGSH